MGKRRETVQGSLDVSSLVREWELALRVGGVAVEVKVAWKKTLKASNAPKTSFAFWGGSRLCYGERAGGCFGTTQPLQQVDPDEITLVGTLFCSIFVMKGDGRLARDGV